MTNDIFADDSPNESRLNLEDDIQTMALPQQPRQQRSTKTTHQSPHLNDDTVVSRDLPMFFDGSYISPETSKVNSRKRSWRAFMGAVPKWRYVYNATLVLLDFLMMFIAVHCVYLLLPNVYVTTKALPGGGLGTAFLFSAIWVFVLATTRMYERHLMGEGYRLYAKILTASLINFIALCSMAFCTTILYPHWLVGLSALLCAMLTMVERWLMRRILHRNRRQGEYNYPTVLVGSPQGIYNMLDKLSSDKGKAVGYVPIAVCPVKVSQFKKEDKSAQYLVSTTFVPRNEQEQKLRVLPLNSKLPQTAKFLGASAVLITDVLKIDSETTRTLALAVEAQNLELAMTASVADLAGSNIVLRHQSSMPILSASLPQYSWGTRFIKRSMDIVGSLVALIPSMILIIIFGAATKLEDGGPIFYKQERIGLYGKPFNVLKLRSMRVDADKLDAQVAKEAGVELGATFKVKDDPRITKVGKFIRKISIDEVPQFINVLRGDMSLVGPRPQRQYEVDQYSTLYSARLLVRPGITGPWQIGGRNNLSQKEAEMLDVSYVENWSIMTDIAILLKTVVVVIQGDGAY